MFYKKTMDRKVWLGYQAWWRPISNGSNLADILEDIPVYQILRHVGICNEESTEYGLICFCDASGKDYATVIYLHQSFNNTYKTDLIFQDTIHPRHYN